MLYRSLACSVLVAGGLAATAAFAGNPLQHSCLTGLFKRADSDPKEHPLPPVQKLEQLVDNNSFKIRDLRNNEQFVFQVMAAYPGNGTPALMDLSKEIADDGQTLVAPVDLTGSGVSDLIYTRKDWGAWKVLSNGSRLPKPVPGFVAGFYPKGQDSSRSDSIPADTRDLVLDHDLLTAVGDFLGNGTEQLGYTRPGWSQVWIVGAHGVTQMAADLEGIEGNGSGPRTHWLFPFKSGKGAQHTKLAYYRMGCAELATFAPRGMAFKRDRALLKGNWEKLSQNVLDWPQNPPSQLERKTDEAKDALAQVMGDPR